VWQTGSIRVGRIGGIAVDVHITFGLAILWGAWQGWFQYGSLMGAGYGILLVVLLFLCILLHELGHGLQARAFGIVARRITLLPIGGLAQLDSPPAYPGHELLIALAGPLVNLALALALGFLAFVIQPFTLARWIDEALRLLLQPPSAAGLLFYLVGANLTLFLFNMIPAFPMDGGRVLRSGMALVVDYELATRLAAWLGRILALAMGILGLIGWPPAAIPPNPLLALVGLMVFFGAQHEETYVRRQRALVRVEVGEIANRNVDTLSPWDPITTRLAARLLRHEKAIPVVVEGRVVGLLTYQDLRRLRGEGQKLTVAHAMRSQFPALRPRDTLWVALQEMHSFQLAALPVVDGGILEGVIALDDIHHAWRFAVRRRRRAATTLAPGDTTPQ
jgi:Zn-dependent protease/CBS domain-containing protein